MARRQQQCTACSGTGRCGNCSGTGLKPATDKPMADPVCGGTGNCQSCHGTGSL